jgi:hypothetical protein
MKRLVTACSARASEIGTFWQEALNIVKTKIKIKFSPNRSSFRSTVVGLRSLADDFEVEESMTDERAMAHVRFLNAKRSHYYVSQWLF